MKRIIRSIIFRNFPALALICVGMTMVLASSESGAQELKPVVVATVVEAEAKTGRTMLGTVQPLRRSTIGSAVDGRVELFSVNQGDRVKQGQVLAQLRTTNLKIQLAAAEAELDLAKQQLAELVNGSRKEDIAEAEANMQSSKAGMQNASSTLKRFESLATTRAASTADLDDARQNYQAAKFSLAATEALLARLKAGPRAETIAQAEAQVELRRHGRALLQDQISRFTIVSPFDGFVAAEFTEVGAWISRGDPIAQVIQLSEIEIETPVPAEAAVNLKHGEVVRVEFPELPDQLLTGTVDRIVPVASPRSRTFPILVRLKNPIEDDVPMLLAGMMASVNMPAGRRQDLPVVPKDALVLNGRERFVFVVKLDPPSSETELQTGTVHKVPVDLGIAVGQGIQCTGEIHTGDLVVVVGNERLVPNAKVKIVSQLKPASL